MTATTPALIGAQLSDLSVRYGRSDGLRGLTATIRPGTITGLLGPNGSGKTTLASVLAGFRRHTGGTVRVGGRPPYEDAGCAASTCLVREAGDVVSDEKIEHTLTLHAALRPTWDDDLARRFLDRCGISTRKKPAKLSRGQRSVVGAAIGLGSRAPLTIFDEVHLGMDAETRYAFYEELLADYANHPRTIVLSSHLIGEVEHLLEDVLVIGAGRAVVCSSTDDLRSRLTTLVGPAADVDRVTAGRPILTSRDLGPTREVTVDTVDHPLDDTILAGAPAVQRTPLALQDAVVALTKRLPDEGARR